MPVEKRIAYLRELKPDVGALNMGSMNYAKYSRRRKEFVFKAVFENSFDTIIALLEAMNECGIRPEHECFDSGHLANLDPLLDMGAAEAAAAGLVRDGRDRRHPADGAQPRPHGRAGARVPHQWGVIGICREQWTLVAAALALGGNVRVGLEDNFYLPDGEMARSNGDLVAKARAMAEDAAGGSRPWPRRASCWVYERARSQRAAGDGRFPLDAPHYAGRGTRVSSTPARRPRCSAARVERLRAARRVRSRPAHVRDPAARSRSPTSGRCRAGRAARAVGRAAGVGRLSVGGPSR